MLGEFLVRKPGAYRLEASPRTVEAAFRADHRHGEGRLCTPHHRQSETTVIDFRAVQNFSRMSFDLLSVETEAITCESQR